MTARLVERLDLRRGSRSLPTILRLPDDDPAWPLVVFAHGWMGHPDIDRVLNGRPVPPPHLDESVARLESGELW